MVKITCFGAAGTVTGSNYLIDTPEGYKLLIDCGLFQGGRAMERLNYEDWGYDPREISHLVLTHAHIDHSGKIPKLVKDGFRGKIVCTPPTRELCEIMLLDAAHVQQMDAEWKTKKKNRQGKKGVFPLYTTDDAVACMRYFDTLELYDAKEIVPGVTIRLRNAGHVLGSAIIELWIQDGKDKCKIVFSGDLGRHDQIIVNDPDEIFEADHVFIESTYGNRSHRSFEESKAELLEAIRFSVSHKEKILIPAFALERTQEILYLLGEFYRSGQLPDIPVFLDSPLAIRATEVFRRNKKYYDAAARAIVEKGFDPFAMPNLKLTPSTQESMEINQLQGSAIIIAGNGMCTAGRIKHHLKHNLWRYGSSLIIVGFQSEGSTGRQIVDGAKTVNIFGERIAVRAKVYTIGGFSAHADQTDLLAWVGHFLKACRPYVYVVHGEPTASLSLAETITNRFGLVTTVPQRKNVLNLERISPVLGDMMPRQPDTIRTATVELAKELLSNLDALQTALKSNQIRLSSDEVAKLEKLSQEISETISMEPLC